MKLINIVKYKVELLFLAVLLLGQTAWAVGPSFSLTPNAVSNNFYGTVALQISGLASGESVVVQKYLDLNTNGAVDSADLLVQQFTVTDGQAGMVIAGVTNVNVPGDTDGTNDGQINAKLLFNDGDFTQAIIGTYLYVVSSPSAQFSAITHSFTVANAPYPQQIIGKVLNGAAPVSNAVVILFPPALSGHGPGSPIASGIVNTAGVFSIQVPVGSYVPLAISSNYVADFSASPTAVVTAGSTISNNLSLAPATEIISAKLADVNNTNIVLPGVFVPASANGLIGVGFSDSNGVVTIGVGSNVWNVASDSGGFPVQGHIGGGNGASIDTTGGNQTGILIGFNPVTTLFYGHVHDNLGNPLAGIDISASDASSNFSQDALTDVNGYYVAGIAGGLGSDPWSLANSQHNNPTNYIFTQPDFDLTGGTNINSAVAAQVDFTALIATNHISGHLKDNAGQPISGIGIFASATVGSNSFQASSIDTATNGSYSFNVGAGVWTVGANCGCTNGDCLGTNYLCPNQQTVTVSNADVAVDLLAVAVPYTISGVVTNAAGQPVSNLAVNFVLTIQVTNVFNEFAQTDNSGHFSIPAGNGSWDVSLSCSGATNSLNGMGYVCASDKVVVVSGSNAVVNFAAQRPGQIQVFDGATQITNGQAGAINFGTNLQTQTGLTQVFTVTNSGGATLNLTGLSVPSGFTLVTNVTSAIPAHSTSTFTVQLNTASGGVQSGSIIITNSDATNGSFSFPITGTVTPAFTLTVSASPTNGGTVTGGGLFASGSANVVTASPNAGFAFTNWTIGGVSQGTSTNLSVVVNGNVTVVANFLPIYTVSTSVTPVSSGNVTGAGSYVSGTNATVVATPANGFVFADFTQGTNIVSVSSNYTFAVSSNITLVAHFTQTFTVAVSANPTNGGTVGGGGSFNSGTTNTVTASANSGFAFTNWTVGGVSVSTSNNYSFIVTSNTTLVANFTPVFTVTVTPNPLEGGTLTGGGSFVAGRTNTATATAGLGFLFTNFTQNGIEVSTSTNYSFVVNSNIDLVANFLPTYNLSVIISPTNGGAVTGGGVHLQGSTNTVTATPNAGFIFTNFVQDGNEVSTSNSYTLVLSSDVTLVANFLQVAVVTVSANPTNGGAVAGGGTFLTGTSNTVTATPTNGYIFTNWTQNGTVVSLSTNYTFAALSNVDLVANFLQVATIDISANPTNGGALTGGGTFVVGSTNQVTATPSNGFAFTNWTVGGTAVSTSTNYSFVLTSNISLVANFIQGYTLTVFASPTNGGTVTGGGPFVAGTTNTVTATAGSNFYFTNFTINGVVVSTSSNYSFALNSNVTIVANFPAIVPATIAVAQGTNILTNGQSAPVDFGAVPQTQTGPILTFNITNTGGKTLTLSQPVVTGSFTLVTNAPTSLAPGSNGTFSIQFNVATAGSNSGAVTITNNDTSHNPFTFPLTAFVQTKIISVTGNLAFGRIAVGDSLNQTLTISNLGNSPLAISGIEYPTGFSGAYSNSIASGASADVVVTFLPASALSYGGTVMIDSDATSGSGAIAASGFGGNGGLVLNLIISGSGSGTVTPNLNGQTLTLGKKYTIKAVPAAGSVFSNWTGAVITNKNPLTFTMAIGTVIQANFVTNPFTAVKGIYNGIFSTTNGVTEQTAGMLKNLNVSTKGTYTGSLLVNGSAHPFNGAFDLGRHAFKHINRPVAQGGPLSLDMTLLDSTNPAPQVTGTVVGTNAGVPWNAILTADLATNTLAAAEYTMLILPDVDNAPPTNSPGGAGYALITNSSASKNPALATARITGALADGTAFNQTVPVSKDGYVPVYANLYASKGLLLGWINLDLTNGGASSLNWIHPVTKTGLYKNGFTNYLLTNQILLSAWTNPPAVITALSNLSLLGTIFDTNAVTNIQVNITAAGKITGNGVTGTVAPKTGLLKVAIGVKGPKTNAVGVIQNGSIAGGYYVTKTNAQAIKLTP